VESQGTKDDHQRESYSAFPHGVLLAPVVRFISVQRLQCDQPIDLVLELAGPSLIELSRQKAEQQKEYEHRECARGLRQGEGLSERDHGQPGKKRQKVPEGDRSEQISLYLKLPSIGSDSVCPRRVEGDRTRHRSSAKAINDEQGTGHDQGAADPRHEIRSAPDACSKAKNPQHAPQNFPAVPWRIRRSNCCASRKSFTERPSLATAARSANTARKVPMAPISASLGASVSSGHTIASAPCDANADATASPASRMTWREEGNFGQQ